MTISCEVAALRAVGTSFRASSIRAGTFLKTLAVAGALFAGAPAAQAVETCKAQWTPGMCKLVHVLEIIEARHADATVAGKLVTRVMDHLAKEVDPYSNYYDVEAYRELRRNLEGRRVEGDVLTHRLLPGGRAYIRLHTFSEATAEKLADAVTRLSAQSNTPLTGVVLDLRDNPGGLVRSAVAVASVFLPRDAMVISTKGDGIEARQELRAEPGDYLELGDEDMLEAVPSTFRHLPLTVLVNRGSASASEILAAALQDHRRATIIGTRTYGKGTVQTIIPLEDDTAIKFTTSYFYTPNGRKVDGQGVTPDLVIKKRPPGDRTTDAARGEVASAAVCQLHGGGEAMIDVNKLSGEDRADCQLQQAILTLSAPRLAAAR